MMTLLKRATQNITAQQSETCPTKHNNEMQEKEAIEKYKLKLGWPLLSRNALYSHNNQLKSLNNYSPSLLPNILLKNTAFFISN
jgi:hypothetical protein